MSEEESKEHHEICSATFRLKVVIMPVDARSQPYAGKFTIWIESRNPHRDVLYANQIDDVIELLRQAKRWIAEQE